MGLTLYSAAAAMATFTQFIPPAYAHIPAGPFVDVKDCLTTKCPSIDEKSLHPKVAQAFEQFSTQNATFWEQYWSGIKKNPEYLRFRKDDLRDKSLFIYRT